MTDDQIALFEDALAVIDGRAKTCRAMASGPHLDALAMARLNGKAAAYEHAAGELRSAITRAGREAKT
jgi:hypothetical protein